jgi:hypothetical protein
VSRSRRQEEQQQQQQQMRILLWKIGRLKCQHSQLLLLLLQEQVRQAHLMLV